MSEEIDKKIMMHSTIDLGRILTLIEYRYLNLLISDIDITILFL